MSTARPLRPCRKPGCRNLTRTKYCAEHQYLERQEKAERNQRYAPQRDKQVADFYRGTAWQAARLQALTRDHGICQKCLKEHRITPADTVHHIEYVKDAWEKRLVLSNLVSLCNACHNAIHKAKAKGDELGRW